METNSRFTPAQNEDFKKNVCIPYFKDIYKVNFIVLTKFQDLSSRSDDK